jgi:archaellum biogenesis ATPase FlaH
MDSETDTDDPRSKIPIGVPSIDSRLNGGVRPGTTILASGPFGTGYQEFLRTAMILHGNWQAGTDLFDLTYSDVPDSVRRPSTVRYIAVNDSEKLFRRNVHDLADDDVAYPALDNVTFHSLASEVADLGPIKPSEEGGFTYASDGGDPEAYEDLFKRFDDLIEGEPGEVVFVDSISDFFPITDKFLDPSDFYFIAQTLCHAVSESDSVLIAAANTEHLKPKERALLKRTFEAALDFGWSGQGGGKRRTMTITKFPEFRRESGTEQRAVFDLRIDRENFGISQVQKIPPSRL